MLDSLTRRALRPSLWVVLGSVLSGQMAMGQGQQPGLFRDTYSVMVGSSLITLPSVVGVNESKAKALGIIGSKASVEISGAHASVRLRADDAQIFVVTKQPGTAAETLRLSAVTPVVQLHKLDVNKKGNREWLIGETTSYIVTVKGKGDTKGIPVNVSAYGGAPDSIQIEPRSRLNPGEYAFVTLDQDAYQGTSWRLHSFGIDR